MQNSPNGLFCIFARESIESLVEVNRDPNQNCSRTDADRCEVADERDLRHPLRQRKEGDQGIDGSPRSPLRREHEEGGLSHRWRGSRAPSVHHVLRTGAASSKAQDRQHGRLPEMATGPRPGAQDEAFVVRLSTAPQPLGCGRRFNSPFPKGRGPQ